MRFFVAALVGILLTPAILAAPGSSHVLHERGDSGSQAWVKRGRVDAETDMPVRIGLTQSNLDKGYDLLMEV
jgi:tripeptidyl-peptidase-1